MYVIHIWYLHAQRHLLFLLLDDRNSKCTTKSQMIYLMCEYY